MLGTVKRELTSKRPAQENSKELDLTPPIRESAVMGGAPRFRQ